MGVGVGVDEDADVAGVPVAGVLLRAEPAAGEGDAADDAVAAVFHAGPAADDHAEAFTDPWR